MSSVVQERARWSMTCFLINQYGIREEVVWQMATLEGGSAGTWENRLKGTGEISQCTSYSASILWPLAQP